MPRSIFILPLLLSLCLGSAALADEAELLGHVAFEPDTKQVVVTKSPEGLLVKIQPGESGYPGFSLTQPDRKPMDLSAHGHLKARITNTGSEPLDIGLRADNAGDWKDEPYNTENLVIPPGKMETIHLIFGHSYGRKKGYALDPAAVTRLLIFTGKTEKEKSFTIHSIGAGGDPGETPPKDPGQIRIKPTDGALYLPGEKTPGPRLEGEDGATIEIDKAKGIRAHFNKENSVAKIQPEHGRWDLSQCLRVIVTIRNEGSQAVRPTCALDSNGGPSDTIQATAEIAPGTSMEVIIPFISAMPWRGNPDFAGGKEPTQVPGTGSGLLSDAISTVAIRAGTADAKLLITAIRADVPPPPKLPEWLGKKPPLEGNWVQTFAEEFDGKAIDDKKWNVHAANYWDKMSWFSRDNVVTGDGVTRLRYEKRTGHHNDDPAGKEFHYATGVLDTYGKWTQRYGYFEIRAKLPTAPGLWPAFWLMPERGKDIGEQWQRQDTGNGGMEFDILEHLTRWGPYRNNIAMHWDGYGEEHKQLGTDKIYMQPDAQGFITVGLGWLPGKAIYYINGTETARWENDRISSVPSCLLFTLPQGGWDNSPIEDSKLPDDFIIDYVRIWQLKGQ